MTARDLLGNLDDYDLPELLLTLVASGRGGLFEVRHPDGLFHLGLREGRVTGVTFGIFRGLEALAALLTDPRGTFAVRPEDPLPTNGPDLPVLTALLAALRLGVPVPEAFRGPAKVELDPDEDALDRTERRVLTFARAGRAMGELDSDEELAAVARFARVGVLSERRARVARLTVGVWKDGPSGAIVDASIVATWAQQVGRTPHFVQLRTDAGRVLTLRLRSTPRVGNQLLLTPEALVQHGLRVGSSVLARPGETPVGGETR
ncbi:DUF4388 domain-containing protein [Deinococcus pimensis]|uniref:DUF4388 domain-containing protein n=1 Tax=Deinococcus pimensis TaxID=309888 RepID=UPI00048601AF|nr:DUF4388 domain-containing protein [Deinococcus pimensis]